MSDSEVYAKRVPYPAEGLTLVLKGIAGDDLGQWRWDRPQDRWVNELGQPLTLTEVENEVRTLIRRTPDGA